MAQARLIRTEAIVLRQRPIGDADKVCVLFSPLRGRVEAVAKGVRKTTSKLSGHVAPLSRGAFGIVPTRSLDIITQAQTLESWPALHDDIDRLTEALAIAELIDRSTEAETSAVPLYMLLRHAFGELAQTASPRAVRWWFTLHFLDAQGYRPELDECVRCRADVGPDDNGFAAADGGIVCPACHRAGAGSALSSPVFRLLRYMRRSSCEATAQVRVDADASAELERHLRLLVEQALDGQLRSRGFAEAMARAESVGRNAVKREDSHRAAV